MWLVDMSSFGKRRRSMSNETLFIIIRVGMFACGVMLVLWTISQALRSFVLPRRDRTILTHNIFRFVQAILSLLFRSTSPYEKKDRVLAMVSPIAMFVLPMVWLALITLGYAAMYWALRPSLGFYESLVLSGSSLLTLGFAFQNSLPMLLLAFTQAAIGMMLVALLVGFLPTLYSAIAERERMVMDLGAYAGSPPEPIELIRWMHVSGLLADIEKLAPFWLDWRAWFLQTEEHHTSLAAMNYFRSSRPNQHWVTTAGAVLDTLSIVASSIDVPGATTWVGVLMVGTMSLRSISDYWDIPYDPDPKPSDPIGVKREEFLGLLQELEAFGVPIHSDHEECWNHFSGWRVNYDAVMLGLAKATTAPYGFWSSDRVFDWRPEDIQSPRESRFTRIRPRQDVD
jgi:hypothetical protein